MQSKHKRELESLQDSSSKTQRDLEAKLKLSTEELEKALKAKKDLEKQLVELKSLKDDIQKNLEKTITEIENMKKIHQDELRGLMMRKTQEQADLETKYKAQLGKLISDQIQETEEMKEQFSNASELLDQKHKQLEEKFDELQLLYDNRPSRNEDLELIRELTEQCKEKEARLRKAAEDMKFYKLELQNREENYNKVFGSKPVIGFYNPLQEKV
eukprot:TRINITY_DN3823_c0_g4_i2.p3 TRINITY_DN3823_c0_g4~~TRINITY_DN3823_c0_g4_i2.p3  ORF type:complete len:214 (+),score=111.39 TRINITY_DN3823_c0_g4_i2:1212-1853(+)